MMPSNFPSFSHIYIEKEALSRPLTQVVTSQFPKAIIIEIDNYRELFNQPRQNWREQKQSQKLILAVKHGNRVHKATEVLPIHSGAPLYYASPVLNCLYDCQYCFLQAMYRSANMVVFVNEEDFYQDVKETIKTEGPITLSVSYDCDLLASEAFIPWTKRWISAAAEISGLTVEIRSKSANYSLIKELEPNPQVILAWSMSPTSVWSQYEHLTASPERRLRNIIAAVTDGWRTRICLDPVIPVAEWQEAYRTLIKKIFTELNGKVLEDVSVGVFRMGADHLRNLKSRAPTLNLLQADLLTESTSGITALSEINGIPIATEIAHYLSEFLSSEKTIIW